MNGVTQTKCVAAHQTNGRLELGALEEMKQQKRSIVQDSVMGMQMISPPPTMRSIGAAMALSDFEVEGALFHVVWFDDPCQSMKFDLRSYACLVGRDHKAK